MTLEHEEHGVVRWLGPGRWVFDSFHPSGVVVYRSFRDLAFLELYEGSRREPFSRDDDQSPGA